MMSLSLASFFHIYVYRYVSPIYISTPLRGGATCSVGFLSACVSNFYYQIACKIIKPLLQLGLNLLHMMPYSEIWMYQHFSFCDLRYGKILDCVNHW